mgnify:CR=1 FL=1
MDTLRNIEEYDIDDSEPLVMQCLHWNGDNEFVEDEESSTDKRTYFNFEHVVKIYGVDEGGHSVSLRINKFKPYFYIKVPSDSDNALKTNVMRELKESGRIKPFIAKGILHAEFVERKEFYGFTNQTKFKFIKLTFQNLISMRQSEYMLREDGIKIGKDVVKFTIYESNILPFIRFMHEKKLDAAGWITIPAGKYFVNDEKKSNCQIDVEAYWDDVSFKQNKQLAPFLTASFDIECNSSHGDFPLAKKNYKKLSSEVYDNYSKIIDFKSKRTTSDANKKSLIKELVGIAFSIDDSLLPPKYALAHILDISKVYTENNVKPDLDMYDVVAKKLYTILERQETYKILTLDILSHLDTDIIDFASERQIKSKVVKIIEDAFSDYRENNTYGKSIQTIFTKTNKKPNKRDILEVGTSVAKIIKLFFRKVQMIIDIEDEDVNIILGTFCKNEHISRDTINKKIQKYYEIDDDDCKILMTHIQQSMNQLFSLFDERFPVVDASRSTYCNRITEIFDAAFPKIEGDKVVQIGTTVQRFGETGCFLKHIITLNGCTTIDGVEVESYDSEEEVLLAWTRFIQELDPDIITGYNIFGFDFSFMWERAEELGIVDEFALLGRERYQPKDADGKRQKEWVSKPSNLELKKLSSSALGDNILKYISMEGRIVMDLLKIVQKDFNLVSYKLDNVAETFINDKITHIDGNKLTVNGIINLAKHNYITINYGKDSKYKNKKFKVLDIDYETNIIQLEEDIDMTILKQNPKWTLAKDDVSPQDIFRLQDGSDDDRKTVAVYCIQDCALCITLIEKLKLITNNIGMANVCYVPISFLFLRGQGIKIFSLVAKECRDAGYLIPVIKHKNEECKLTRDYLRNIKFDYGEDDTLPPPENTGGYEGAIVLKPNPGIYIDSPVTVLDYSSLYPSSMISENLSHDSIILETPENKKYLGEEGEKELAKLGYGIVDITYDVYEWINPKIKSKGKKKTGVKTCRFVQPEDGSKSIIPNILRKLLSARKSTRKLIKFETVTTKTDNYSGLVQSISTDDGNEAVLVVDKDGNKHTILKEDIISKKSTYSEFEQSVFDGLQLAYKLTANSLYGQIGAQTSPIYLKDIAAATTATGRKLLYLAKEKVEEKFDGAKIVYGDTDSIFINFNPPSKGRDGLKQSIDMGVKAEEYIQQFLKPPHKLEYEKTFWPFILFSKKRYIGNKYEFKTGENDYKQTSMGIVLKRRDNAEIVKHVYGGVIDILVNKQNVDMSISFLKNELIKLLDGKFPMDMLVVTKSLRGFYKNPEQIAHKVLADRIGIRDPGNKPSSNDRIPYVYIETKDTPKLQGDRIETPDYIKEQGLKPDYMFYITNQIMKPVAQIYSLIVEDLKGFKYGEKYYENKYKALLGTKTPEKAAAKIDDIKFKDTCDIIFADVIRKAENKKNKSRVITDFFGTKA